MTQVTDTDIQEIKTAIESIAQATQANTKAIADLTLEMRVGFANVNTRFAEVRGEIAEVRGEIAEVRGEIAEVRGEIKEVKSEVREVETKLLGKIDTVNARLTNLESNTKAIADLAEKVGELKNWKQIAIVIFTATVGGAIGWLVKGGK